jgi:hypothetical protein
VDEHADVISYVVGENHGRRENERERFTFLLFSVNIHRMVFSCTIKSSALSHMYSAYVSREVILLSLSPAEKRVVLSNKTERSKNLKFFHQATSKQQALSIRAWPRYE